MTIHEGTIKERLKKTITKVMVRPTHTSIENLSNKFSQIGASIKTPHTELPKETKFGYTVAIIIVSEYRKQFTQLDVTWTLTNPKDSATYDPSIKSSTADVTNAQK